MTELRADVLSIINSARITGASGTVLVALLQKAILRYIAYAQAGVGFQHYDELDYISKQAVPWSATDEFLEGWASLKGVGRKPAVATAATSTFAYVGNTSADVPAGTSILRNSDGFSYTTLADATVIGGSITVTMQATVAGSAGNFDAGAPFTLGVPITGVQSVSTASAQVTAGADIELDDSLRTRMLQIYAAPPQGGDSQDYIDWTLAVPGVTRAWVAPLALGPGTVSVYSMWDTAEAANGGFPQGANGVATNETRGTAATGDQLEVANAIYPKRPVTALVYSIAPAPTATNITVADLGASNTAANKAAIAAALTDMFLRLGNVGGAIQPATGEPWPPIEPDAIYAAIESVPGLTGFKVTTPTAAISPASGYLPTLGTLTCVT